MADKILVYLRIVPQRRPRQVVQVRGQIRQEPPMLLNLIERYPLDRIGLQHALDQVFHVRGDLSGHVVITLLDLRKQELQLLIVEGQTAAHHCVQNHPTRPNIDLLTAIRLATDDLWCSVVGRPTRSAEGLAIFHTVCQTKVNELYVMLLVE